MMKSRTVAGRGRILVLMLIMAGIAVGVATNSMLVLWHAAFEEQRNHLVELVRQRARTIESIARFDDGFGGRDPSRGRDAELLAQLVRLPARFDGSRDSSAITLVRLDGGDVVTVAATPRPDAGPLRPAAGDSDFGEAMRRAVSGQSGDIEVVDGRGARVLAAYEPVAFLDWGLVAQVDVAEFRAPFVEAGAISGLGALVIIALGAVLFHRVGSPLAAQIEATVAGLTHTQRLAHVGSCEWDIEKDDIRWSDETYRILGRTPAPGGLTFDDFLETVHPDDRDRVQESMRAAMDGDVTYTHDRRILRPDGSERIVHGQGEVVFDGRGRPSRVTGTIQDVTDRRRAEAAIRESEARLQAILGNVDEGISLVDSDLDLVAFNQRFLELLEFPEQLIAGRPRFEDFVRFNAERGEYGPGDIDSLVDERVELAKKFLPHRLERTRPDGTAIEIRGNPIPGGGFVTTYTDITERKRAEDALRESEGRYRSLVELSPMPVVVHRDGVTLYANAATAELVGAASASALVNRPLSDLVHPDYRTQLVDRLQALADGEPMVPITDYVLIHEDGRPITVEAVGANITFEGAPAIQTVVRDVTERRRTEAATRESERRLRAILEASPIGVAIIDPDDGAILFANTRLAELYGRPYEEVVGSPVSDYFVDPEVHSELLRRLDGEAGIAASEVSFKGPDDTILQSLLTVQRIEFEGASALSAWIYDITDRKHAEEEFRRQQALFEAVFRDVPDAMVLVNPQREIIMANPAFTQTFGYTSPEILGRQTAVLYESREEFDRQGRLRFNLSARETLKPYVVKYRRRNGEVFPGETVGTPIRDRDGNVLGFVGVMRDITERVEAEAALKDSEARLQAILGNVDEGISLVDSDLDLVAFNQRFLELLEFPDQLIAERPRFEDFVRFNAERGEYGPGDIDSLVDERVELAKEFLPHRFERTRPDGTAIEIRGNPVPGGGFVTTYTDITERKRAEEALRESETRFRTLTDSSNHGILVHRHLHLIYANPALLRIFGYASLADLQNLESTEWLVADDDRDRFRTYHEQRLRGESVPSEMEMRAVRADGREIWINILSFRIELEDEPAVCTTMMDITERKRAEAALSESEARFRTLVEHAPEAIVVFDVENGRFVDVNENAENLFDADQQTLLGIGPNDLSPPLQPDGRSSDDAAREMIGRAVDGETPSFEWVHRTMGGEDIPCEVRLVRLPSADRILVRGSVTDITRRKRSEILQRGRNTVLEMLAAGAPLERVLSHLIGTIEAAEPEMLCSVLLLDEDGEHLRLGAAPSLPDFYNQAIDGLAIGPGVGSCGTCAHTGEPIVIEDIRSHPYWEQFRDLAERAGLRASWSQPIGPPGGEILGTFAMYYRDPRVPTAAQVDLIEGAAHVAGIATGRRRDEDRARRQNEELAHVRRLSLMGELATGLAHEINQPLTVISSYAQGCQGWLRAGEDRAEDILWAVGQIAQQAERASAVIERIRSFVRRQEVHRTPAEVNAIIEDAIGLSQVSIDRSGVELDLRLSPHLPTVLVDEVQVQQVILNLINNALDAMHQQPVGDRRLTVETSRVDEDAVAVSVRDTGHGIEPEIVDRIFDAFFTTKADGLGLGLSICCSIVESHGGRLSARSDDGRGAEFRFTLPWQAEDDVDDD